ncbi:MAG: hypothetical protein C0466_12545 [Candidatus Accumulibacter sp.]|nr:hypothetical protein [Accumulibacter sp.]
MYRLLSELLLLSEGRYGLELLQQGRPTLGFIVLVQAFGKPKRHMDSALGANLVAVLVYSELPPLGPIS